MAFRIAFTEDNQVNRTTFQQKLKSLPDFDLIFSAVNGHDCLEQLKGLPVQKLPEVIFMDIEMPQLDGIETIKIAKPLYPEVHFIVLTVFDDDDKIFEAIRSGASGYLLKHEPASTLQESVVNVLQYGGAPMSPAIARKVLSIMSQSNRANSNDSEKQNTVPSIITTREEEILQHMVQGKDAKRIAATLNISVLTVRKHIANIYDKLHVQSRAEIITMAHKNNWF
ncbi:MULTISPECIES: response regulator [unclassified Paraflavitalea]|uniref:response regulator n=1 Tax=unclassified Paraflavitalea TaxID=2798305 RepID=UPI003D34038A